MTEYSWPSTNYNGDALTDDEYERLAADGYLRNGVVGTPADAAIVFADSSGRNVKFRANVPAFVQGQRWHSDATVTATLDANTSGSTRIDLATLRLDRTTWTVSHNIVKGIPGSGQPAPVQNAYGSGFYDFPCGAITVADHATTIAGSAVRPLAWYIGDHAYLCTSSTRPPNKFGRRIEEYDTGRSYVSTATTWVLTRDNTEWVNAGNISGSGWSQSMQVKRMNGVVYTNFNGFTRTGGTIGSTGKTDPNSNICTVPAGFRPGNDKAWNGYHSGAYTVLGKVLSTGVVVLDAYFSQSVSKDDVISPTDISWPAEN